MSFGLRAGGYCLHRLTHTTCLAASRLTLWRSSARFRGAVFDRPVGRGVGGRSPSSRNAKVRCPRRRASQLAATPPPLGKAGQRPALAPMLGLGSTRAAGPARSESSSVAHTGREAFKWCGRGVLNRRLCKVLDSPAKGRYPLADNCDRSDARRRGQRTEPTIMQSPSKNAGGP